MAPLLELAPHLLAIALSRQRLLRTALVTRLQVERVLLDVLDDVFLLHFSLEPAESTFNRLALLHLDFGHARTPPLRLLSASAALLREPNGVGYHSLRASVFSLRGI